MKVNPETREAGDSLHRVGSGTKVSRATKAADPARCSLSSSVDGPRRTLCAINRTRRSRPGTPRWRLAPSIVRETDTQPAKRIAQSESTERQIWRDPKAGASLELQPDDGTFACGPRSREA